MIGSKLLYSNMSRKLPAQTVLQWPLDNGQKMNLICGRVLGKGGFGRCYEVISRECGRKFACKAIDKQSAQFGLTKQKVRSEVGLHRRLTHPHIVRFESTFEDEQFIYILLELCTNNTLEDVLHRRKQLTEVEVRYYMRQILEGVSYMHEQRVVHRDLKLQNFFISDQMALKIGDFGLAAQLPPKTRRRTVCGTPNYMAPEIFTSNDGYSFEVDVWSLGIIAFLLLCGRFPFEDRSQQNIPMQFGKGLHFGRGISVQAQNFVGRMLQVGPRDRSSVRQLLGHDFLTMFDIPQIIPVTCLVCDPTIGFTGKFLAKRAQKLQEEAQDQLKFQFLLQSKESPESQKVTPSPQLDYKHIQSEFAEDLILTIPNGMEVSNKGSRRKDGSWEMIDWVAEYWQHPRKGLLFRSNKGSVGLRLNDGSNIQLADHTKQAFLYLPPKEVSPASFDIDVRSGVPREVKMKTAMLLRLVSGMLLQEGQLRRSDGLFVRLYLNTLQVFLIWLSNGALQGKFRDGSLMVIARETCIYMDDCGRCAFKSQERKELPQHIQTKWKIIEGTLGRMKENSDEMTV